MMQSKEDPTIYSRSFETSMRFLNARRATGQEDSLTEPGIPLPEYYERPRISRSIGAHFVKGFRGNVTPQQIQYQSLIQNLATPQHTTLESPTGQWMKEEMNLPYQSHSATDINKAANFYESAISPPSSNSLERARIMQPSLFHHHKQLLELTEKLDKKDLSWLTDSKSAKQADILLKAPIEQYGSEKDSSVFDHILQLQSSGIRKLEGLGASFIIPEAGEKFVPEEHEASEHNLQFVTESSAHNTVGKTFTPGLRYQDKVLRKASISKYLDASEGHGEIKFDTYTVPGLSDPELKRLQAIAEKIPGGKKISDALPSLGSNVQDRLRTVLDTHSKVLSKDDKWIEGNLDQVQTHIYESLPPVGMLQHPDAIGIVQSLHESQKLARASMGEMGFAPIIPRGGDLVASNLHTAVTGDDVREESKIEQNTVYSVRKIGMARNGAVLQKAGVRRNVAPDGATPIEQLPTKRVPTATPSPQAELNAGVRPVPNAPIQTAENPGIRDVAPKKDMRPNSQKDGGELTFEEFQGEAKGQSQSNIDRFYGRDTHKASVHRILVNGESHRAYSGWEKDYPELLGEIKAEFTPESYRALLDARVEKDIKYGERIVSQEGKIEDLDNLMGILATHLEGYKADQWTPRREGILKTLKDKHGIVLVTPKVGDRYSGAIHENVGLYTKTGVKDLDNKVARVVDSGAHNSATNKVSRKSKVGLFQYFEGYVDPPAVDHSTLTHVDSRVNARFDGLRNIGITYPTSTQETAGVHPVPTAPASPKANLDSGIRPVASIPTTVSPGVRSVMPGSLNFEDFQRTSLVRDPEHMERFYGRDAHKDHVTQLLTSGRKEQAYKGWEKDYPELVGSAKGKQAPETQQTPAAPQAELNAGVRPVPNAPTQPAGNPGIRDVASKKDMRPNSQKESGELTFEEFQGRAEGQSQANIDRFYGRDIHKRGIRHLLVNGEGHRAYSGWEKDYPELKEEIKAEYTPESYRAFLEGSAEEDIKRGERVVSRENRPDDYHSVIGAVTPHLEGYKADQWTPRREGILKTLKDEHGIVPITPKIGDKYDGATATGMLGTEIKTGEKSLDNKVAKILTFGVRDYNSQKVIQKAEVRHFRYIEGHIDTPSVDPSTLTHIDSEVKKRFDTLQGIGITYPASTQETPGTKPVPDVPIQTAKNPGVRDATEDKPAAKPKLRDLLKDPTAAASTHEQRALKPTSVPTPDPANPGARVITPPATSEVATENNDYLIHHLNALETHAREGNVDGLRGWHETVMNADYVTEKHKKVVTQAYEAHMAVLAQSASSPNPESPGERVVTPPAATPKAASKNSLPTNELENMEHYAREGNGSKVNFVYSTAMESGLLSKEHQEIMTQAYKAHMVTLGKPVPAPDPTNPGVRTVPSSSTAIDKMTQREYLDHLISQGTAPTYNRLVLHPSKRLNPGEKLVAAEEAHVTQAIESYEQSWNAAGLHSRIKGIHDFKGGATGGSLPAFQGLGGGEWFSLFQKNMRSTSADKDIHKGYLTFKDPLKDITVENMVDYHEKLTKAGYTGQFKVHAYGGRTYSQFDNVVMHGADLADVNIALKVAHEHFGSQIDYMQRGVDVPNHSYTQHLQQYAEDTVNKVPLTVPALPTLASLPTGISERSQAVRRSTAWAPHTSSSVGTVAVPPPVTTAPSRPVPTSPQESAIPKAQPGVTPVKVPEPIHAGPPPGIKSVSPTVEKTVEKIEKKAMDKWLLGAGVAAGVIGLIGLASIPKHTTLESPSGKKMKEDMELPYKDHSATDFEKAAKFWDTLEKHRKRIWNYGYDELTPEVDKAGEHVLNAVLGNTAAHEGLSYLNDVAKKGDWENKLKIPDAWEKAVKDNPKLALAVAAAAMLPGATRMIHNVAEWHRRESANEAESRAKSHQTLESPTGQQIKSDLDLPYKAHSQFDYPKITSFFDTLELRYSALFKPIRSALRRLYTLRTEILEHLAASDNRFIYLTTRAFLYAESVDRKLNFIRPITPSAIFGRMMRSAVGVDESKYGKMALEGLVGRDLHIVKGAGLFIGATEAALSIYGTYHHIKGFLGRHAAGPYEDREQKAEDKRRRRAVSDWRQGKGFHPEQPDDQNMASEIKDEALEFANPAGSLGRISDTFMHPDRHKGTWAYVAAFSATLGAQVYQRRADIFKGEGAISTVFNVFSELTETKYVNARAWIGFGSMAAFGLVTGKNWSDRLGGFGGLGATVIADVASQAASRYLFKFPVVQEGVARGLLGGVERYNTFFNVTTPKPLLKFQHEGESLRDYIANPKAFQAKELEAIENKIALLGQETMGPIMELLLLPVLTHLAKSFGHKIDELSAQGKNTRDINQRVAQKKREQQDEDNEKGQAVSQKARALRQVRQGERRPRRRQSQPNPPPSAPPPRQSSPQEKQQSDSSKHAVKVSTHINENDRQLDLQMIQQGHMQQQSRGYASFTYSDYHANN